MYQIVDSDGKAGDPIDMPLLKEMAADGRLLPETLVLDPISGQTLPACDMFVHEELFARGATGRSTSADSVSQESSSAPLATPEPRAVEASIAPSPDVFAPPASALTETAPVPAVSPVIASPVPLAEAYPSVAVDGDADLSTRFVGWSRATTLFCRVD